MKLVRFVHATEEGPWPCSPRLGALSSSGQHVVDLAQSYVALLRASGATGSPERIASLLFPSSMRTFIELGEVSLKAASEALAFAERHGIATHPLSKVRLLAPLDDPPKIVGVGLNYREHVAESGAQEPQSPVLFAKFHTAIVGPLEPIPKPRFTEKLDYEVELAVVIGRGGRGIPEERALEYVFGYTVINDVSARDLQFEDGQWIKGKTCDGFAPMGPALVSRDEIPDPHGLEIWLEVNGQTRQRASTASLIFGVPRLVAYLSSLFSLEPGDVIATGTPSGVGMAQGVFLRPGDRIRAGISRIGVLENVIVGDG